jgi:thermitase
VNPEFVSDVNLDGKLNLDDLDLNHNKHLEDDEVIPGAIGIDFVNGDSNPIDDHGHGTHIAGIAAATKNGKGVVGVAPQAKILIIKAMDKDGVASYSNLAKAIAYASKYADIANNSWTGDKNSKLIRNAFLKASQKGMISVAAAGNAGSSDPGYPAAYTESVIGVASSTVNDNKSKFSNYGSYLVIAAPGGGETSDDRYAYWQRNILSTIASNNTYSTSLRDYFIQDEDDSLYLRLAGTSMSTAYVAGAAALLKSLNKKMTYAEIKQYIVNYGDTIDTSSYGFTKRLNVFKSVYNAKYKSVKPFKELS